MKKRLILILLLLLVSCQHQSSVTLHEKKIFVETANTDEQRSVGLMYRTNLDPNKGMLFVYPNEDTRGFWMKNTLIPLDMIFINSHFKIIDIHSAEPCKNECIPYGSAGKAQYVLEVNKNYAQQNNIHQGDTVEISF